MPEGGHVTVAAKAKSGNKYKKESTKINFENDFDNIFFIIVFNN